MGRESLFGFSSRIFLNIFQSDYVKRFHRAANERPIPALIFNASVKHDEYARRLVLQTSFQTAFAFVDGQHSVLSKFGPLALDGRALLANPCIGKQHLSVFQLFYIF